MRETRDYGVDLPKLGLGRHQFAFQVGDAFFAHQEDSPLSEAQVLVKAEIDKTSRMLDTRFSLEGWIGLECDRCLRPFHHPVNAEFRVIYSFDRDLRETEDAEVVWIDRNLPFLDFTKELYDFILLQEPLRRIPPDCPTDACAEALARIQNAAASDDEGSDESDDGRWAALRQLRERFPDADN